MNCPVCGSDIVISLGRLGKLDWFRCRNCGIDFAPRSDESQPLEDLDYSECDPNSSARVPRINRNR